MTLEVGVFVLLAAAMHAGWNALKADIDKFEAEEGRRPRIMTVRS